MKIEFILNEAIPTDPKGRQESFILKLKRIFLENKYKYRYLFIRFTNHPERQNGINPKYNYDTPLGIYSYPFNEIIIDKIVNKDRDFEFATDMKAVVIFGWNTNKTDKKTVIVKQDVMSDGNSMDYGNFTKEDYTRCRNLIKNYLLQDKDKFYQRLVNDYRYATYLDIFIGYNNANPRCIDVDLGHKLQLMPHKKYESHQLLIQQPEEEVKKQILAYLRRIESETKNKLIPFAPIFNISRVITKDSKKWSRFMRDVLGISCIIDKGTGLIHSNEPEQAVFLEPHKTDVVAVLDNLFFKKKSIPYTDLRHILQYLVSHEFVDSKEFLKMTDEELDQREYDIISLARYKKMDPFSITCKIEYLCDEREQLDVYWKFTLTAEYIGKILNLIQNDDRNELKVLIKNFHKSLNEIFKLVLEVDGFGFRGNKNIQLDLRTGIVWSSNKQEQAILLKIFMPISNKLEKEFSNFGFEVYQETA